MSLKLTILGYNSAVPKRKVAPTAQLLEVESRMFLIDCGEERVAQKSKSKIFKNQSYIYFTSSRRSCFWADWSDQFFSAAGKGNTASYFRS